jgi:lipopolysaccharide biosynthesis glycosyltransferase
MNTRINVAFCADESYLQHLCVSLQSLLLHNTGNSLDVYVVSASIADNIAKWLNDLEHQFDVKIILVAVNESSLLNLPTLLHFSRAMYYRLMLADLLQVERIIYLDSDTLIESDLLPLWEMDLGECGCAGVSENSQWHTERLQLSDNLYINSGVLVLDLQYWRNNNIKLKCMEWVQINSKALLFPDQDAINFILAGSKIELAKKWNLNPLTLDSIDDLANFPDRILHFSGSIKPWHLFYDFDLQQCYIKYLKTTPWESNFELRQPGTYGQSLCVANQHFNRGDTVMAAFYYWHAMKFYVAENKVSSVFLFEVINVALDLLAKGQHGISCNLFRSCMKQWNLPIEHTFNVYMYPGFLQLE